MVHLRFPSLKENLPLDTQKAPFSKEKNRPKIFYLLVFLPVYLGLMHEVDLVLHEHHGDVPALVLHLPLPLLDGVEGGAVSGGEGNDACLGPAVVRLCDGVKLLLTGRVPQHQPDVLPAGTENNKKIIFLFLTKLLSKGEHTVFFSFCTFSPGHSFRPVFTTLAWLVAIQGKRSRGVESTCRRGGRGSFFFPGNRNKTHDFHP